MTQKRDAGETTPDSLLARDPLCLAMFAAWMNVTPDQVSASLRAHTCEATAIAWQRVADAARAHIEMEIRNAEM